MSEKTISELIRLLRRASPGTAEHYACVVMLEASIVKAEAAERAIDAYIAFTDVCDLDAWHVLSRNVKAYKAACNTVCKLEESSKSD